MTPIAGTHIPVVRTKTLAHFATSPISVWPGARGTAATALLALVALAAGCNNEFTCVDLGCEPGYHCDPDTEKCVEQADRCQRDGCPSGRVCNTETGQCVAKTIPCGESGTCPDGQVCNGQTGFCEAESGCTASDCGAAEQCDELTGECVARRCSADTNCPRGFICVETGQCTSGCRLERPTCPSGQRCWPVTETTGQCLNRCTGHRDCPHGQYCATEDDNSVCRPEGPCSGDDDCIRSDEVCRNGACTAPPCQANDDCPSNQACDRATGLCVGGDCSDDSFAPNQTRGEATPLAFETITDLRLCPGKDDWFALDVESAESVSLRLRHPADTDLDITVFDADGKPIAVDQQAPGRSVGTATASVSFVSDRAQTLAIRIYTTSREAPSTDPEQPAPPVPRAASYELTVARAADLLCQDDRSEENDSRRAAEQLPGDVGSEPAYPFLKICGGDVDWFRIPAVRARAQLEAELRNAPSHIQLEVLADDGTRFLRGPGEPLRIWRNAARQDWYFRISSNRRASGGYNLTYVLDSTWRCPDAGSYGDAGSALALSPGERKTFALCPVNQEWEDDWIALEPPSSETYLDVHVFERGDSPPLEVTLLERTGDELGLLRATERRGGAHGAGLEVDADQEIVVRVVGIQAPGNLVEKPEYEIVYDYEDTE